MSDRQSARLPRRAALCSMLALCAGFALQPVAAQSAYPDRPIRMIVPYPPGGATDVIGRVLAKEMSGALG